MMQRSEYSVETWEGFLTKIRSTSPITSEKIKQFVKIKQSPFPTDSIIIDYYESIFSKITSASDRKKWHQMDKYLLVWCVAKVLKYRGKQQLIPEQQDWLYLSQILDVNQQLLENKWLQMLHSNMRIKKWTQEEDRLLVQICNETLQNNNWTQVAVKFNSMSRTQRYPKQIRERYNNVLNPTLRKSSWTEKENQKLIELVKVQGKKWSKLCIYFEGRSENQLKQKFNALTKSLEKNNIIDKNNIQAQRTTNKITELINVQQNDQLIAKSQNSQKQEENERKQEPILIKQHCQQPQCQFLYEQNQIQPIFHNNSNHYIYPQYTQRQQFYQNTYYQTNSLNYPYKMPCNADNVQLLSYYHY